MSMKYDNKFELNCVIVADKSQMELNHTLIAQTQFKIPLHDCSRIKGGFGLMFDLVEQD